MKFSDDRELEARIGKVCLVLARVEQEGGHIVMAAQGNWDLGMSPDYLEYSSNSSTLLGWLENVAGAYPEVKDDLRKLRTDLRGLKRQRDRWAHSAAVVDLWLMMKEKDLTTMTDSDIDPGKLLNGKQGGHLDSPTARDVDSFVKRASDVGDAASGVAVRLAQLANLGIRPVRDPH